MRTELGQAKKGILKSVLSALGIAVICMIGIVRTAYVSDAFTFSIFPIAGSIFILCEAGGRRLIDYKKNLKFSVPLTFVFFVMLSAEEVIRALITMDNELFNLVFKVLFLPMLLFSVFICVDFILRKAGELGKDCDDGSAVPDEHRKEKRFLGLYKPVWLIVGIALFFVLAYFPGPVNPDLDPKLVGGGTPNWSDWHTIGFEIFCYLCMRVVHRTIMISFVQLIMLALTVNYVIDYLYHRYPGKKKLGWIVVLLFATLGLFTCMNISDTCKDNNNTYMLLAFSVSILFYFLEKKHSVQQYVIMVILGFLASIFRHAMLIVVLVTLAFAIIFEFVRNKHNTRMRKALTRNLACVVLFVVILYSLLTQVIGFGMLKAEKNSPYVKYSVVLNVAASMAYRNTVTGLYIDEAIVEKMEQVAPLEKWSECYCPYDADPVSREYHMIGNDVLKMNDPKIAKDIIMVDLYYLTHHPKEFLISYLDITSLVWEVTKPKDLVMYSPAPYGDDARVHLNKGSFFDFSESLNSFLGATATGRTLIYRGGIYVFIMLIAFVILFMKKQVPIMIAMMPVFLYAATLMVSIPQPITRYVMAFPLYAVLFGIIALLEQDMSIKTDNTDNCED